METNDYPWVCPISRLLWRDNEHAEESDRKWRPGAHNSGSQQKLKFSNVIVYDNNYIKVTKRQKSSAMLFTGSIAWLNSKQRLKFVKRAPQNFLQAISNNLPEQFSHFRFTPILCGSMPEGTKCYQPDEFGFMFNINTDAIEPKVKSSDARFVSIKDTQCCTEVVKFAISVA